VKAPQIGFEARTQGDREFGPSTSRPVRRGDEGPCGDTPGLSQNSGRVTRSDEADRASGQSGEVADEYAYQWRGELPDEELVDLVASHGGRVEVGWWDRIRPHSLGWVTARTAEGTLVGFVNVAWDGGAHAFLLDTKTRGTHQRRGVATRLVEVAMRETTSAGCEWLHVDFEDELGPFYFDACGFRPAAAGLIRLRDLDS
jgi:ribosomal protein S18 acetylase RimI-like enzyme